MAEADQRRLTKLYSEGIFTIPDFQRNYAWKPQHVRDLLQDIYYIHGQNFRDSGEDSDGDSTDFNVNVHYFGQLLLQESGQVSVNGEDLTEYRIIDGQQRLLTIPILIRAILDEIERLDPGDVDPADYETLEDDAEKTPLEVHEERLEKVPETFLRINDQQRVTPTRADDQVYNNIINSTASVSEGDIERPSHEYLKGAYDDISSSLTETLFDPDESNISPGDDDEADRIYARKLLEILEVISGTFKVTRFIIDDTSEAGRFFETENDRGRDLTTKDKVKGYLIYCANQLSDSSLAEEVSRAFKNITESITEFSRNEQDVETFLDSHWRMFNGDPLYGRGNKDITDLHRQIKRFAEHAHLERTDRNLEQWIRTYLESLQESAKSYRRTQYPLKAFDAEIDNWESNQEAHQQLRLHEIRYCAHPSNTAALLMACDIAFSDEDTERWLKILDLLQKFTFRIHAVPDASRRRQRKKMNKMAFKLHWAEPSWTERVSESEDLFNVDAPELEDHDYRRSVDDSKVFESQDYGYDYICDQLESGIGNYAPHRNFEERLLLKNISEGDDTYQGWSDEALSMFMWSFENHLRNESGTSTTDHLDHWDSHVAEHHLLNSNFDHQPDIDTGILKEHESAISTLIPLEQHDDSDLDDEWTNVFNEVILSEGFFVEQDTANLSYGPFHALRDFVHSEDESAPELDEDFLHQHRTDRINWALRRWGVESEALAFIAGGEDISKVAKDAIASDIRDHYDNKTTPSYNIPKVSVLEASGTEARDGWELLNPPEEVDPDDYTPGDIAIRVDETEGAVTYELASENEGDAEESDEISTPPYILNRVYDPRDSESD